MIKNAELLIELDRKSVSEKSSEDWYEKADALYETAMSLNPDAVKKGGREHIKSLINVREKLITAKKQMPIAQ
ncbi:MAG TPA: hypothetical protein VK112_11850 [Fodinibius sp.]|nr:hypothetical protein [Fodinibius sp.]